jgi:dipeptidyl aminopeptidase/acylaminoacyl peptidase
MQRSKLSFPLLFAAAVAILAPQQARAQSPSARQAGPLPLELAFSKREVRRLERPVLSPDGRWLAYEVYAPPLKSPSSEMETDPRIMPNGTPASAIGLRLYVSETAGGKERAVCAENQNCWRPSWSADSRQLAYYSDAGGFPQAYVFDLASSKSRRVGDARIKAKLWPGDEAAWSPDGREIFVPVELSPNPEPEPGAVKAPKTPPNQPTVKVWKTGAEAPPAAKAAGGTPEAMLQHFIRENNATLAAIDVASGKMRVLVPAETEPRPACMRLSPDGNWVSYLSIFKMKGETASETFYDIGLVPASGGKPVVLAADVQVPEYGGSYFGDTYRWVPGTTQITFLKDKKLWLADAAAAGRPPRQLGASLGNLEEGPLLLSSDGKAVLVGQMAEGEKTYYFVPPKALALVPFDGGAPKVFDLTGDPIASDPATLWQPDANGFFVLRSDEGTGERSVVRVETQTGKTATLWKGRGRLNAVGGGGRFLVARYESLDVPADFFRFDPKFASRERITRTEPRLEGVRVGPMESFRTKVPGYDGKLVEVESAIFLPANRKPKEALPTIVYFYAGSRVGASAQDWGGGAPNSIPVQIFATRGYAVLLVDVPLGPQGKGGNPIQEMTEAILPQVHHASQLGFTDLKRVAIMGQSYGGYGTAAVVTQTNLFRAAIALDGLYDLAGSYARMDRTGGSFNFVWSETGQGRMGTHPWADLRRYLANSPYYQADKIHTPLLLIHGKNDETCPVEGAERMYNALKRLERTTQLAVYAGEGHVPGDWSLVNAVDAAKRMLEFLEKYLLASGSAEGKRASN